MDIKEKLLIIQNKIKVNKDNFNEHGNFSYRSCEDILEKVKPLCLENKCLLMLQDEIVMIGDRFYVKVQACLHDIESKDFISSTALAREIETRKGFDESQLTGSSSSYARKYALAGMFALDDGKDADSLDNTSVGGAKKKKKEDKEEVSEEESLRKEEFEKVQGIMKAILKKPNATPEEISKNQQDVLALFSKHNVDTKNLSSSPIDTLKNIEKDLKKLAKSILGE